VNPANRKPLGTRPPVPVRQGSPPDDWLCTWSYRKAVWSCANPPPPVWELKFIHAACPAHAHLVP
jgi:hypothetical protein